MNHARPHADSLTLTTNAPVCKYHTQAAVIASPSCRVAFGRVRKCAYHFTQITFAIRRFAVLLRGFRGATMEGGMGGSFALADHARDRAPICRHRRREPADKRLPIIHAPHQQRTFVHTASVSDTEITRRVRDYTFLALDGTRTTSLCAGELYCRVVA